MNPYYIFSLIKISIGLIILGSLYVLIDPFTDPLIALSGVMVGIFLLTRGGSFFMFIGREQYIRHHTINTTLITHSYKLSLLFGIYILFNIIFLLRHSRTLIGGIVLLISFLVIQALVLPSLQKK